MQEASLCRLCLCPTVDGGVPASQVDRDKLEDWCLNFMEHDLAEEVEDADVFCFFCVWDAQLLLSEFREEIETSELCWWPEEDFKSTNTLKKSYLSDDGVRPSSLRLEKIAKAEISHKTLRKCIYCGKEMKKLGSHMLHIHRNLAIRCKISRCSTYFHSFQESRVHLERVHKIPQRNTQKCLYCGKVLFNYRRHVRNVHCLVERCIFANCKLHFYTRDERDLHVKSQHQSVKVEKLDCAKNGPMRRSKRKLAT